MHAVALSQGDEMPEGVIFILRSVNNARSIDNPNRLHPFYMVYIQDNGEIKCNHLEPHKLLSYMRLLCKGVSIPQKELCHIFNEETQDGFDMQKYSELLRQSINSIIKVKEESDIESLFSDGPTTFGLNRIQGLDDFELIAFLVLKKAKGDK